MTNPYLTKEERRRIESAKIGIAGCGGLGSNVAMHLVRMGFKRLVLCDFDVVGESNLNRQFFFRNQLGMKKTGALKTNLLRIEPDLELETDDRHLDVEGIKALYAGCDVLVEALDKAEIKAQFYNAFLADSRPVVGASGIGGFGRSNSLKVKKLGANLYLVGDGESDVERGIHPQSARVGIAAAMEANTVAALVLGLEV